MKLRRESRTLKTKALSSLRRALTSFNGFEEDGRVTAVLLHAQHACEMLLKAMLVQRETGALLVRQQTYFHLQHRVKVSATDPAADTGRHFFFPKG